MVVESLTLILNICCLFLLSHSHSLLPPYCTRRGLVLQFNTLSETHTRYDSPGRGIGPWQRSLTTHNTHTRQTTMLQARFAPATPESGRPQTRVLGYGNIGARNYTTHQSGQTPDKEVEIKNITVCVSSYTETDTTGMLSPPTVWSQQCLFRANSLVRFLLQCAQDSECRCNVAGHACRRIG